jgi:hypothetical protein
MAAKLHPLPHPLEQGSLSGSAQDCWSCGFFSIKLEQIIPISINFMVKINTFQDEWWLFSIKFDQVMPISMISLP